MTIDVEIDTGMNYTIYERVGALNYRPVSTMTFEQFQEFQDKKVLKEYWHEKSSALDGESAVSGRRLIPKLYISPVFDRLFGGNYVDIQPTGFVNMDFGGRWQKVENPLVPVNQQRNGNFDYNQQISMNVVGKVGEKLAVTANFDNNNTFDFQNNLKIEYTGYEEDIIKKIELGNVSMSVPNSLIDGGQSLFGIKTELQFGKVFVTALASRHQGTRQSVPLPNRSEDERQPIAGSDYDDDRHFFLAHYFRENFEEWLSELPNNNSPIEIKNLIVYKISNNTTIDASGRVSAIGLSDLAEFERIGNPEVVDPSPGNFELPQNESNDLWDQVRLLPNVRTDPRDDLTGIGLVEGKDFELSDGMKKLEENEYELNKRLGYISLNQPLRQGEFLAVAFEYFHNGRSYEVGETLKSSQELNTSDHIILKLLRGKDYNIDRPIWDLMMKNIYYLGQSGINESDIRMTIKYEDYTANINQTSLSEGINTTGIPLIRLLKVDQLNPNNDRVENGDGSFDFIEGATINSNRGYLIFPILEPFGQNLDDLFTSDEDALRERYVFNDIYDIQKSELINNQLQDRFYIYTGLTGGATQTVYQLNAFNVTEGSVQVQYGAAVLTEGTDFIVDYNSGTVTITNDSYAKSGEQPDITFEQADVFSFSSKWLTGARVDYQFNDKTNIGGTIMHMSERTGGISRFAIGDEPISNTLYGFDVNFQDDSRLLTKIVDAIPIVSTKETSTVTFKGEFAQLLPGTTNQVNGESTSYIDDFESTATPYSLMGGSQGWTLGSMPNPNNLSNEEISDDVSDKRAKMSWYTIDRSFYISSTDNAPDPNALVNHYERRVSPNEIYSRRNPQQGVVDELTFDVAFFPKERGPYNYNDEADDFDSYVDFKNSFSSTENYGSITRDISANADFAKNNIEFIEFWLMDPFADEVQNGPKGNRINSTGGKLFFHLGEVSEDVLPDGKRAYENGLPLDGDLTKVDTTRWGRISNQSMNNQFFPNTDGARDAMDVGIDGLGDADEEGYFETQLEGLTNSVNPIEIPDDVSGDNYKFYFDGSFTADQGVVYRYKDYNGMDGNSPLSSGGSFTSAATNQADAENANDNLAFEVPENYYEYEVDLRPAGTGGNEFITDEAYVADVVRATPNGFDPVDWYLIRIPIRQPTSTGGTPNGFSNMRFMRMYMTGWEEPVVLRMASFRLMASQWRKYQGDLSDDSFGVVPEPSDPNFEVSVVSVEQNPNYVLPPGINRDFDNSTTVVRQINEQSIQLCVTGLEDGDSRAVFKNSNSTSIINYGKVKMFFHAEEIEGQAAPDSVRGFLRLGRDDQNYYQIEVPLTITPNDLSGSLDFIRRQTWPEENEIDISIESLYGLKDQRNKAGVDVNSLFTRQIGKHTVTVRGNPKLSKVDQMMIGIRNPKDDNNPQSVCIWANELRMTDFDDKKGWAANARMNVKLADLANLSASTDYSSAGFGGVHTTFNERSQEERFQYNLNADISLDKFIPWKTGLKIPMSVSKSESKVTPRYDPLEGDIPLDVKLREFNTEAEKDDYLNKVVRQQTSRSISFNNVRKEKVKEDAKEHFFDIENFAFNYSYSETKDSDQFTAERLQKKYNGSVAYNYSPQPPSLEPFKKGESFSSPYLQLIKDINFTPLPNNFTFRAQIDRTFTRTQRRNDELETTGIDPYYEKLFYFDRVYAMKWNIFKNLNLSYDAKVNAIIDEPEGNVDIEARRDIWNNIKSLGRTKNFSQNLGANYRIPLDKIPLIDWIGADYRYTVQYDWRGTNIEQIAEYGNTISNSVNHDLSGKIDFVKLYNKSKALKKINTPPRRSRRSQSDTTKQMSPATKGLLRFLMMVRSANITYSKRLSTELNGFTPDPYMLGMDRAFDAPGVPFLLGSQDPTIRFDAARNGWLVNASLDEEGNPILDSKLTAPFTQTLNEDLNIRATVEPVKSFRIQVDMRRTNTSQYNETFKFLTDDSIDEIGIDLDPIPIDNPDPGLVDGGYVSLGPSRFGSYSVTFLPIGTTFKKDNSLNESDVFNEFSRNRDIIKQRLDAQRTDGAQYSNISPEVMLPAFIAAYTGRDVNGVSLSPIPKFPMPNWRVDYAGLSKLEAFKNIFSSVSITHAYQSIFSIASYENNTDYQDVNLLDLSNNILNFPEAEATNDNGNLIPVYNISAVNVSERFSPFLGLNLKTKSGISFRMEYGRERTLNLDLTNRRLNESKSGNYTFDFGWNGRDWKFPFKIRGRTKVIKNELRFRTAFTVRDNKVVLRSFEESPVVQSGDLVYQIRPSLEYVANQRLNITMYFDKNINTPRVSSSYARTNSAFGVQIRFSLSAQ